MPALQPFRFLVQRLKGCERIGCALVAQASRLQKHAQTQGFLQARCLRYNLSGFLCKDSKAVKKSDAPL